MADTAISALPNLAVADIADADKIPIVDASAALNKHILASAIVKTTGAQTIAGVKTFSSGVQDGGGQVFNVKAFGATGDGSTNDATAIGLALTAAAVAGGTVLFPPATYRITSALTVGSNVTLRGEQATIVQATSGAYGLTLAGNSIVVEGLTLQGPQYASSSANETAIFCQGVSAASPRTNIIIRNCRITSWGGSGVGLYWVTGFSVEKCVITNIYSAGIITGSGINGVIDGNRVSTIGGGATSTYGIAISRAFGAGELTDYPRSANVVVSHNVVENVTGWKGIDTHGGEFLTFSNNVVKNCKSAISVGSSPDSSGSNYIYPARFVTVVGNICDGVVTNGSASAGIGCTAQINYPTDGIVISGNTVRNHGGQASSADGGITLNYSRGAVVSGNTCIDCSPNGIIASDGNTDFVIDGNTITDPWTDNVGVGFACGIQAKGAVTTNTGVIGKSNRYVRGSKSATYVLNFAANVLSGNSVGTIPLTYGTTVTPDTSKGNVLTLVVTNTTAFAIAAPLLPSYGQVIHFDILNSSGGAMGTITWNAAFHMAGSFTNPADTKRRTISFVYVGSIWVELSRAAADI